MAVAGLTGAPAGAAPGGSSGTTTGPGRGGRAALLVALPGAVVVAATTAYRFDSKPLWRDEFYTLSTADRDLAGMVEIIKGPDIGLAGYYAVMHVWMLAGDSTAWLRVPGAVCTVAIAVLCALLGRRLAGTAAGVVSGLVVALLPAVVGHAQEARAYPLVLASLCLTVLLVLQLLARPTTRASWALAVVAALPGCLHPIVGFPAVVGILLGAFLAARSPALRRWLVVVSVPAASGGLLLMALGFRQQSEALSREPARAGEVLALLGSVAGPVWADVLLWVLAAVGAVGLARRGGAADRRAWPVLLAWASTPVLVVALMGFLGSFFHLRYASAAAPALAVLASTGVVLLAARVPRVGSLPAVAAATVVLLAANAPAALALRTAPSYVDDPRSAALALAEQAGPGDAVVYNGRTARGLTTLYLPASARPDDALLLRSPLESQSIAGVEVAPSAVARVLAPYHRVWMVGSSSKTRWSQEEKAREVARGRTLESRETFGGYRLELFVD